MPDFDLVSIGWKGWIGYDYVVGCGCIAGWWIISEEESCGCTIAYGNNGEGILE